jgi:hypothetical protein
MKNKLIFSTISLLIFTFNLMAQKPKTPASVGPTMSPSELPTEDSVLVTVIFKHQQDKNLMEIRRKLEANGFWDIFPPKDSRVISWNIVMGLGQVVALKIPTAAVRNLNLSIQNGAWGAYDTEIFLSYDYMPIWSDFLEKRNESKDDKD